MSSRATSLDNLCADLYPIGGDSYRDFVQTTLNIYEAGTLLYYTGDWLSAHANEFVFEENELPGIETWQQEAANYLCAYKLLAAAPSQWFGSHFASPEGVLSSSPAEKWPMAPLYGQLEFPFDKLFRGWTFQQFKGAWQNLMCQCATPSWRSQGWKIYSCHWIISSAMLHEGGGYTCMWTGFPNMSKLKDYQDAGGMQHFMRGSWGLEYGGIFGRLPGGNTQTLATMSCDVPFAGGDSRTASAYVARGSAPLFQDLSGVYGFLDPGDVTVGDYWPREYTPTELKDNTNGVTLFSGRMHFPLSDLLQSPSLSARDGWMKPAEVRNGQQLYIRGSVPESIADSCPPVHAFFKEWRALADCYFTHMQHEGHTMRMASHDFHYALSHTRTTDKTQLAYHVQVSVDNAMTKCVTKVTSNVSYSSTSAAAPGIGDNEMAILHRQWASSESPGETVVPLFGHYMLENVYYELQPDPARGIVKIAGLGPAMAAQADSLFPPTVWQQKMDDIVSVQNLSSTLLLSAQQQLSAVQSELSGYYDDYFDDVQDAWGGACAPYGYLDDFDWSSLDKTDFVMLESDVWDYVWDQIVADPSLTTEEQRYERIEEIEQSVDQRMEDNGGNALYNTMWNLRNQIMSLQSYISHLPERMQLSVDTISASTSYHVELPDPNFLTAYISKSWEQPATMTAEGDGSYTAEVSCICPLVSSQWSEAVSAVAFLHGTDAWPLPQLMHMQLSRGSALSVEDCIATRWDIWCSTSAEVSSAYVDGCNKMYDDIDYLSADYDYIQKMGDYAQIVAQGSGMGTKQSLSGTRPDLQGYLYNGVEETPLSSLMPPDTSSHVECHDTGDVCTYEGKEAAVLELVLVPLQVGGVRTTTYAAAAAAPIAEFSGRAGGGYPTPPPLSVLKYYDVSPLNPMDTVLMQTYRTRFRATRMPLADIAY